MLPDPGPAGTKHRGQRTHGRIGASNPFGRPPPRLERLLARKSPNGNRPRLGLDRELGRRLPGQGPPAPEGRNRKPHEVREAASKIQRIDDSRRKVFDHEIGAGKEFVERGITGFGNDGSFRCVQELEESPIAIPEVPPGRRPTTKRIAVGGLHLHHVRPGIGHEFRRVGPSNGTGEVNDSKISETVHGTRNSLKKMRQRY